MKLFYFFFLFLPLLMQSQPSPGEGLRNFIPAGWNLIAQASGDLNGDSLADLALVIQGTDKKNILIKKGYRADTIDANPRSLIILFMQPAGSYKLITKNDSFILPHNNPGMDEPFSGIAIAKGNLEIKIHAWYKTGSWVSSEHTYGFHYQGNEFALVAVEATELNKGGGDSKQYSIDFVMKRYRLVASNQFDKKVKPETTWKAFQLKQLKTFATFRKPLTWRFEGLTL